MMQRIRQIIKNILRRNTNLFYIDAGNNRVGIGTNASERSETMSETPKTIDDLMRRVTRLEYERAILMQAVRDVEHSLSLNTDYGIRLARSVIDTAMYALNLERKESP
jgi:uncharacterized protein (UPF0335 family)